MHEVLNHHRVRAVAGHRRLDFSPLGLRAIHQHDPGSLVLGIPALRFGEQFLDHLGRGLAQAGPHPLVADLGSDRFGFSQTPDRLGRASRGWLKGPGSKIGNRSR
jgi:hypothetical protein